MAEAEKKLRGIFSRLKADKKSLFTVILGLTGILLVLLSELPSVSSGQKSDADKMQSCNDSEICRSVEKLLSQIEGAGEVNVMLTFETKGEKIFPK